MKERGGELALIRLGPGRASISCWLKAIHSELVWGDRGCSGGAWGKTELGLTLVCMGSPWKVICWGGSGTKGGGAAPNSAGAKGFMGLEAVGVWEPE